ncbi:tRNA (adenosine(37)-N6)-threonylcarbamoyltransferase complex dimerization subunit type 1 TsaB [candidate division KSB1 bacterium]
MFLCIDTTTEFAGVCATDIKKSVYLKLDTKHASDKILETIDQVIQKTDIKLSDLTGVVVIKGPGSFTGLRVGIAVTNQFAHQLKIPIVGLLTEEWHCYRTDEKDYFYLQTMNRDQVYMVGLGKFARDYPKCIISISECHYELASQSDTKWIGQLNEDHHKKMAGIEEITDLRSADDTWLYFVRSLGGGLRQKKAYELIEPFYGKEPTITKSKKLK